MYLPIACLAFMWNLLTSVLVGKVYPHLSENVLPDEQKGCRKDSRGMNNQLVIDKGILKHFKKHQRNLAMRWIDINQSIITTKPMIWCHMVG